MKSTKRLKSTMKFAAPSSLATKQQRAVTCMQQWRLIWPLMQHALHVSSISSSHRRRRRWDSSSSRHRHPRRQVCLVIIAVGLCSVQLVH
jgi:hypothetical protein